MESTADHCATQRSSVMPKKMVRSDVLKVNMKRKSIASYLAILLIVSWPAHQAVSQETQLKVMTSGGFTAAYRKLVPEFEHKKHVQVITTYGASMGDAKDSIPNRLKKGEQADVVILARPALDWLVKEGRVVAGSSRDLGESLIAVAIKAGSTKPDISTIEGLKHTLLKAKSIAYSGSASGIYLSQELFPRLGIADEIRSKCTKIDNEMVGVVVARGDAEIGFQQLSELLPIPGIEIVGPLPAEAQRFTTFSGGVLVRAREPELAAELLRFFTSAEASSAIERSGLRPMTALEQSTPERPRGETKRVPDLHMFQ